MANNTTSSRPGGSARRLQAAELAQQCGPIPSITTTFAQHWPGPMPEGWEVLAAEWSICGFYPWVHLPPIADKVMAAAPGDPWGLLVDVVERQLETGELA